MSEQIEGMVGRCDNHHEIEKTVDYCFSCDRIEFDGRLWMPVVAPIVMRCADCRYWEIAKECLNYQDGNRYGKCKHPIVQCEIVGDAYIKEYGTDDLQFCSNFEGRST